jgi:hypothetical protein
VHNYYASFSLTNTTVSGNKAAGEGGGVYNAFYNTVVTLTHSTITGNSAASGGGLYNGDRTFLKRTIVSGNSAAVGDEISNYENGTVNAADFNVFGHKGLTNAQAFENFTRGATDINATSNGNKPTTLAKILNTSLANNGGPTRTHALVVGSPAIDIVTGGTCPPPAKDQRGVKRPQDGNGDGGTACDAGSFERRP